MNVPRVVEDPFKRRENTLLTANSLCPKWPASKGQKARGGGGEKGSPRLSLSLRLLFVRAYTSRKSLLSFSPVELGIKVFSSILHIRLFAALSFSLPLSASFCAFLVLFRRFRRKRRNGCSQFFSNSCVIYFGIFFFFCYGLVVAFCALVFVSSSFSLFF